MAMFVNEQVDEFTSWGSTEMQGFIPTLKMLVITMPDGQRKEAVTKVTIIDVLTSGWRK